MVLNNQPPIAAQESVSAMDNNKILEFVLEEPKQEEITDNTVDNSVGFELVEKKVFLTKDLISPSKVTQMETISPKPSPTQQPTRNTDTNPTISTVLENRPSITMTNNSAQDNPKTNLNKT